MDKYGEEEVIIEEETIHSNTPKEFLETVNEDVEEDQLLDLYADSIGLEVKKSPVHGLGLFAKRDFKQGFIFKLIILILIKKVILLDFILETFIKTKISKRKIQKTNLLGVTNMLEKMVKIMLLMQKNGIHLDFAILH